MKLIKYTIIIYLILYSKYTYCDELRFKVLPSDSKKYVDCYRFSVSNGTISCLESPTGTNYQYSKN